MDIHEEIAALDRADIENTLRQYFDATIDERVNRWCEIQHQKIIGDHYFAAASMECLELYRDGHFISTVMVTQTVNEGILKFVAERNNIDGDDHDRLMNTFVQKGIISASVREASDRVWKSFRNDVHHMNPKVAQIPFDILAKRNIRDLATVEKAIFGVDIVDGKVVPHRPMYWDVQQNGSVPAFLRFR